jgi:NAD(P)-dependent dehydrogenase (short-subunit alcohol dehydrogenase family)
MKVLITGGTNGMGKGVAKALAANKDVELVILGRSEPLLRVVTAELAGLSAPERISSVCCDLSRLRDVRTAIDELRARHGALDAVFVNAGLGYAPRHELTVDGLDPHFQVNYLSHFMLVLNLLDLLEGSKHGGRVIFNAPSFGQLNWDDLQLKKAKWNTEFAVGQGMVAKRMFATHLHELYAARSGPSVSTYSFEIPKTVWSNQLTIIPAGMRAMATVMKWFGQFISIEECGEIMAPLFLESREACAKKSGRLVTLKKGEFRDCEKNPMVLDAEQRARMWKLSLELCNDDRTTRAAERLASP